jgi:hypothetical protein
LNSPYTAERSAAALTRLAQKAIEEDAGRRERMRDYLATFNLSYIVPESMKGNVGWRHEWDDHVLNVTPELIAAVDGAVESACKVQTAIQDVAAGVDLDF